MTSPRLCSLALALIASMGLAGCQQTIQPQRFYAPPPKPATAVARLWNGWHPHIKVVAVNGQPVQNSAMLGSLIEVLPGTHQIIVKTNTQDQETVHWWAQAGKEYEPAIFQNKELRAMHRDHHIQIGRAVIIPLRDKRFLPAVEEMANR